ncbi:site-specific integrase [Filimonas effusa]|uniref:Integrase n=1 Tax=Filimonas effusa TaxID=2508721 RepID=A0A4Q1DAZ7_9BACT|nr:site-specific integrase [Filimonas effusa]RXK85743.1 integrase [Filimonas effusa]
MKSVGEVQLNFDSFDVAFYEDYLHFLTYEYVHMRRKPPVVGLKVNTLAKTIRQLRVFLRNRMRRKIIPPIDLEDFKQSEELTDAIYLTMDEIRAIYNLDLSNDTHLATCRDLFVFGCFTGLRFSDYTSIAPNDIRNRTLYKKQMKSDHWVVIPLRDEAYSIFMRSFMQGIPVLSNAVFNSAIKELGKRAGLYQLIRFSYKRGNKDIVVNQPKYAWITSHTCRRSFCTNEFLEGTPVELIMKISGHKSLKNFYRYIKISPEEAGRKIGEIWMQRGELKAS